MGFVTFICFALCSYLLGSVCFAVVFSKLFELQDPREFGSNNPGATNMMRLGGIKISLLTFAYDAFKGYFPLVVARALGFDFIDCSIVGLMVVLGHLYPVFFNFNGGKGAATLLGVSFGFSNFIGVMMLAVWGITYYQTKLVSLSSIIACCFSPIMCLALFGFLPSIAFFVMAGLIVFVHKTNIVALLNKTEEKTKIFSS